MVLLERERARCQKQACSSRKSDSTIHSSGNNLPKDVKIMRIGSVVPEKNGLKNAYFLTEIELFNRLVDFHRIKSTYQLVTKDP